MKNVQNVRKDIAWKSGMQTGIHTAVCLGRKAHAIAWEVSKAIAELRGITCELIWCLVKLKALKPIHQQMENELGIDELVGTFANFIAGQSQFIALLSISMGWLVGLTTYLCCRSVSIG